MEVQEHGAVQNQQFMNGQVVSTIVVSTRPRDPACSKADSAE